MDPARLRASVWRRLRSLGAVYLQNSVATLPGSPDNERALRTLRREIEKMGGTGVLLTGTALAGEKEIVAMIEAARNDEYDEIRDKCQDFLDGIDKEILASHFTFGELEENDEDLTKLRNWLLKVKGRDTLGAGGRAAVEEDLQRCSDALNRYAQLVYAAEDV